MARTVSFLVDEAGNVAQPDAGDSVRVGNPEVIHTSDKSANRKLTRRPTYPPVGAGLEFAVVLSNQKRLPLSELPGYAERG